MALRTGEKRLSLHCRLGLWRNGRSEPDGATDIAAGGADPSAFYVGADGRAVTGGRLTAEAAEGVVTIRSNPVIGKGTAQNLRGVPARSATGINHNEPINDKDMTKADIVSRIAEQTGIEKEIVTSVVEGFMEQLRDSLIGGENALPAAASARSC